MIWAEWLVILLVWLAIGLGVAYVFGRFAGGGGEIREKGARRRQPAVLQWYEEKQEKRRHAHALTPLGGDTAGGSVG